MTSRATNVQLKPDTTAESSFSRTATPPLDWHIITGEYPPQPGGVSDYTRLIARGLADMGDRVTVWAPRCDAPAQPADSGVSVHRLPDHFGPRSLLTLGRHLDRAATPRRLLVQYVPTAFGWKAMNVPFCWWLRSRRHESMWVMFHEVAYPSGPEYSLTHNARSAVTRWMARAVSVRAERRFISIQAWRSMLAPLLPPGAKIDWLPVMSNVRVADDAAGADRLRQRLAGHHPLVGHVGTYGHTVRPLLDASLPGLFETTDCHVLFMGRGGDAYRSTFVSRHPGFASRVHASGMLPEAELSRHVSACDVMLQPYTDGISTRRASALLSLMHGRAVVSTVGHLSDSFWASSRAVMLVPASEPIALAAAVASLLASPLQRQQLAERGRALYAERFDIVHTISALRAPVTPCES